MYLFQSGDRYRANRLAALLWKQSGAAEYPSSVRSVAMPPREAVVRCEVQTLDLYAHLKRRSDAQRVAWLQTVRMRSSRIARKLAAGPRA